MAEITASMVKELREITGLGMMECKKALVETQGNLQAAEDVLRIKSGAKASKVSGRIAAEGVVSIHISDDKKTGAMVEVNCETDFVAKDEEFVSFAKSIAQSIAKTNPSDLSSLATTIIEAGITVEAARQAIVMKMGENMSIRRFVRHQVKGDLAMYLHGRKIGVIVDYQGGDDVLGKDIAMHIAASKPVCVSPDQVSAAAIAKEREIYAAQAAASGKPENIIEKMVGGRVQKYLAEMALLGQAFIKDTSQSVGKLVDVKGAKINAFTLYVVGEGLEK